MHWSALPCTHTLHIPSFHMKPMKMHYIESEIEWKRQTDRQRHRQNERRAKEREREKFDFEWNGLESKTTFQFNVYGNVC